MGDQLVKIRAFVLGAGCLYVVWRVLNSGNGTTVVTTWRETNPPFDFDFLVLVEKAPVPLLEAKTIKM